MNNKGSRSVTQRPDPIDPDPVSFFLQLLAAVGNIVSIAWYLGYLRDRRSQVRYGEEAIRRELADLFMRLEVEHIELRGLLKSLEVILLLGTTQPVELHQAPLEFGGCTPQFSYRAYRKYETILVEISRKCRRMTELTGEILRRLYYSPVELDGGIVDHLLEFREKLNEALHRSMSYGEAFRVYEELIGYGELLSRKLWGALRGA